MTSLKRLLDIKSKLQQAQKQNIACFGSGCGKYKGGAGHRWVSKPLSEEEITSFEQHYSIRLPEEYRAFISEIGIGAGPFYGLLALDNYHLCCDENPEEEKTYLSSPCLLEPRMSTKDENGSYGFNGWEEELEKQHGESWERHFQGTLAIAHQGCAYYSAIVITGPYRGHILGLSLDLACPIFINPSFLDWYEQWLDNVIGLGKK